MTDINIDGIVTWLGNWFQDKLISGTNIKTINNETLLGSGNISVSGGITIDDVYPVGSIYMSVNSVNPSTLFGGTWEQIKDTFLLSSGDTYSNGSTGGSADSIVVEHTHTQNSHNHSFSGGSKALIVGSAQDWKLSSARKMSYTSGSYYYPYSDSNSGGVGQVSTTENATATNQNTGVSGTGKNMPPYIVVNVWKRTA